MVATLLPPDVEAAAVAALDAALTPHVGTRVPNPRPATFVRVGVVSGFSHTIASTRPVLLVECWAATSVAAFALARDAWAVVAGAENGYLGAVWVCAANVAPPVAFPDPDTASPRYQFTAELVVGMTP